MDIRDLLSLQVLNKCHLLQKVLGQYTKQESQDKEPSNGQEMERCWAISYLPDCKVGEKEDKLHHSSHHSFQVGHHILGVR